MYAGFYKAGGRNAIPCSSFSGVWFAMSVLPLAAPVAPSFASAVLRIRPGFIDSNGSSFQRLSVQGHDGGSSFGRFGHFHESKTLGPFTQQFSIIQKILPEDLGDAHHQVAVENRLASTTVPDKILLTAHILLEYGKFRVADHCGFSRLVLEITAGRNSF